MVAIQHTAPSPRPPPSFFQDELLAALGSSEENPLKLLIVTAILNFMLQFRLWDSRGDGYSLTLNAN